RLLADNTCTPHFLHPPLTVGDLPVTVAQLDGFPAAVLDADVIGPDVMAFCRRGLVLEVKWLHGDGDRSGGFRIHGLTLAFPAATASSRGGGSSSYNFGRVPKPVKVEPEAPTTPGSFRRPLAATPAN